jgi:activator of the mannose operon (transcriptional antiterminator)
LDLEKDKLLKKEILYFLQKNSKTSVKKIADHIGKSEKSTRTKLTQLNDFLIENHFGRIDKKPGKGIIFILYPDKQNQLFKHFNDVSQMSSFSQSDEWTLTCLLLELASDNFITQVELSERLYVSIPTLRKLLKSVKEWFLDYHIEVKTITGKGLSLIGDEYSKRIAIRDAILLQKEENQTVVLKRFVKGVSIEEISQVIRKAESDWKIKFSNTSFVKIRIMLALSIGRYFHHKEIPEIDNFEKEYSNEYSFVETLYRGLEKRGFGLFQDVDKNILTAEILVSNKLRWQDSTVLTNVKSQYDNDLTDFVKTIISSISEILQQPLTEDDILQEELTNHLRSAIFRMKYGHKNTSELTRDLKKIYSRVFLSVWATSQLFEETYNVQITEDEIAYIVLYIEAAILRNKSQVDAFLVTDRGRSQSLFASEYIKKNISEIKNIRIIREEEIASTEKGSLYLTTVPLDLATAVPISYLPSNKDLVNIREALSNYGLTSGAISIFSEVSKPLLDPRLIFVNQKYTNKEDVVKFLSTQLESLGIVSPEFFQTVWKREEKTTTCIGHQTAIPHGSMNEVFEPKVAIMILREPIIWYEDEIVDTFFGMFP